METVVATLRREQHRQAIPIGGQGGGRQGSLELTGCGGRHPGIILCLQQQGGRQMRRIF
jgi:hypothetical protein